MKLLNSLSVRPKALHPAVSIAVAPSLATSLMWLGSYRDLAHSGTASGRINDPSVRLAWRPKWKRNRLAVMHRHHQSFSWTLIVALGARTATWYVV
jgi:hypothetical protein